MIVSHFINFESFRREAREWKRFAKIVLLTLSVPLIFIFFVCEFLCWTTGEFVSDQVAADRQIVDPHLVWFAHHDVDAVHFKLIRVGQVRPEVLIMGQSRMNQFRAEMFVPYRFYNLSHVSWPINTFAEVARHLPADCTPKVIIFDLDFYLFNSMYGPFNLKHAPRFVLPAWKAHLNSLRDAFIDLNENPLLFLPRISFPILGLQAHLLHHGFRPDGSERRGVKLEEIAGRPPIMDDEVRWNKDPLFYGDALDKGVVADLAAFEQVAKARGITLIGIQMPMYGPLVRELEKDPHYGILRDFRKHVADGYFERMGIITFDYLDFPPYSDDYHYFAGPFHPTEVFTGIIAAQIARDPRVRAILPKLDTDTLERALQNQEKAAQHINLY